MNLKSHDFSYAPLNESSLFFFANLCVFAPLRQIVPPSLERYL